MREIIDESLNRLEYLPGFTSLEVEFDYQDKVPFYSDRYRLTILMTNLFSNCIRYKDNRKEHQLIRIALTISEAEAAISIFDNGLGIHPDHLPNVFNMFFRANEISDGAGLGLYIVKEVIEKLNGSIDIQSESGSWTHIFLTVPNLAKTTTA